MKHSFLFLLTITLFASCVQTTDDDDIEPQDEIIEFQVDFLKVAALEIKEAEGDNLEVYGTITADLIQGNVTESNTLWSAALEAAISVGFSDVPMTESVTFNVPTSKIASSNLEVRADLAESDGTGTNNPEDLGDETISTPLSNIISSSSFDIVLNDSSGQWVRVTYSITRK